MAQKDYQVTIIMEYVGTVKANNPREAISKAKKKMNKRKPSGMIRDHGYPSKKDIEVEQL